MRKIALNSFVLISITHPGCAAKRSNSESCGIQDAERQLEQQRVWQQTRQLLEGAGGPLRQSPGGNTAFGGTPPQEGQPPLQTDEGLDWDDPPRQSADVAWSQTAGGDQPPMQTIFLEDIYPDGYDELFDLNLNELGDGRIVEVQYHDASIEWWQGSVLRLDDLVATLHLQSAADCISFRHKAVHDLAATGEDSYCNTFLIVTRVGRIAGVDVVVTPRALHSVSSQ